MAVWSVYLLRCADGTVYTGITIDVERRIAEHQSGIRGAKYLRGRGPLQLLYQHQVGSRSKASRLEYRIKKLSRTDKEDVSRLKTVIEDLLSE